MNTNKQIFTIMSRIHEMSPQFTKTDWNIYQFIKNYPEKFIASTASGIAKETGASDASVIRFSQKVGFSGFYELRYMLQKEMEQPEGAPPTASFAALLGDNRTLLERLYGQITPEEIAALRDPMLSAKRVFLVGLGQMQHVAAVAAGKFLKIGIVLQTIATIDALKLYAELADEKDVCILLDSSETPPAAADACARFLRSGAYAARVADEPETPNNYSACFSLPKKKDLKAGYCISDEIMILHFFDLLFDSFLDKKQILRRLDKLQTW